MVNKRFIRKVLSSISTIAITFVTVGTVLMPYGVQAADSSTTDDTKEDSYYINEKYMTLTEEENIGGAIGYGDDLILISNTEKNVNADGNYSDTYKLTADSELRFIDQNGVNKVIKNKDDSGNQKYDTISGTLTRASYTYLKVGKDGKSSFIDSDGNAVKLGTFSSYDEIYMYKLDDGKIIYKLCNKVDDYCYDTELVDENGTKLFYVAMCEKFYSLMNNKYFAIFSNNGNVSYLINSDGDVLYSGRTDDIGNDTYGDGTNRKEMVYFGLEGEYTYYDLDIGKILKTPGKLKYYGNSSKVFGPYYVLNNEEYIEYDNDLNEIRRIPVNYKSVKVISGSDTRLVFTDDNGLSNIYDKSGNWLFAHNIKIKNTSKWNNFFTNGLLIEDEQENIEYILYDSGDKKILLDKVKAIADSKLFEIMGSSLDVKKCTYNMDSDDGGIIFTYELSNVQDEVNILVTYESNYTNATKKVENILPSIKDDSKYKLAENEVEKQINRRCYHIFESVEKNITDEYGRLRECKYRLARTYYVDEETATVNMVVPDDDYYTDDIKTYAICLCNKNGKLYGVYTNGTMIEKYESGGRSYNFGNSGIVAFYSDIRVHGGSGLAGKISIVDSNKNIIYEEEGYSVYESRSNLLLYGYLNNSYRINAYNGELVLKTSGYGDDIRVYHNKKVAYVLLKNGKLYSIKNILPKKLEDILPADSTLNITEMDKLQLKVVTGIGQSKSVDDIKKVFNNSGIRIVDADNKELNNLSMIGTGCSIQIIDNNQVADSAVVMIKGDTDGTGTIDVLDMETIQKSILGIGDSLSGVYKEAALLNGDDTDEVTVLDMEAIQKDILGIEKINN